MQHNLEIGILRTLYWWNVCVRLPLFILRFPQDCHFRVRLGNVFSALYPQGNGVTQRLVLSVTLFAVAISGMFNAVGPSVTTSLYVDDVAIYYSSWSVVTIKRQLQLAINHLSHWALQNGFSFSTARTECMHFTRLWGLHSSTSLYLNNRALPFTSEIMVVSCTAPPQSLRSVLDPVHNTGIHLATGAFHTSQIESLYVESGEPSLSLRRNLLLCSHTTKLATQPNRPSYGAIFHLATAADMTYMMPLLWCVLQETPSAPQYTWCCKMLPLDSCLSHPGKSYDQAAVFGSSNMQKAIHQPLTYHWLFAELYPDYTAIYTSWSDWLCLHLLGPGVLLLPP
jgi:hypothetical protein